MVWSSNPDNGKRFFSSPKRQTSSWDHPASHSMGTGVLSRGKEAWREADTPSSAEVQNEWTGKTSTVTKLLGSNQKYNKGKGKS
jgi:hypothetical protein